MASGLDWAVRSFMTHTSSPGCRYVGEDDRRRLERFFWMLAITVGVGSTTYMVLDIYIRYSLSPVKTAIQPTNQATYNLPHPAITLCNTNRVQRTRAEILASTLKLPDGMNISLALDALGSLILLDNPHVMFGRDFSKLQELLALNEYTLETIMLQVMQPCEEMLERCSWQNKIADCSKLFKLQKTYQGFCCSFNYIGNEDFLDPVHTRFYGDRMGLTVLVNPAADDSFVSSFISNGITVLIHDSHVFPDEHVVMKMVPIKKEVLIPIQMVARKTSNAVEAMSPGTRQCLYSYENHLQYFSRYLDDNCLSECRINYSLGQCGCVPYYYPTIEDERVCHLNDTLCIYNHFETMHSYRPGVPEERVAIVEEHNKYLKMALASTARTIECNCPAQCHRIEFEARESVGSFRTNEYSINQLFGPDTNDTNRILLHVFLESNLSQVVKKEITKSTTVLLALLGGVCSLFLGSSIVTILEFIYFMLIRLPGFFSNKKKKAQPVCPSSPRIRTHHTNRGQDGKMFSMVEFQVTAFRKSLQSWR